MNAVPVKQFDLFVKFRNMLELEGWGILLYEELEAGTFGFMASKGRDGGDYKEIIIKYLPYGLLKSNTMLISHKDDWMRYLNIHKNHDKFSQASWPLSIEIGFVCYCDRLNGMSDIFKCKLSLLKTFGADYVKEIMNQRTVPYEKHYIDMFMTEEQINIWNKQPRDNIGSKEELKNILDKYMILM